MGVLTDALTAALLAPGARRRVTEAHAEDVFESPVASADIARLLNGLALGRANKLPRVGTPARKQYEADKRRIQRYRKQDGQTRGRSKPDRDFLGRVAQVAGAPLVDSRVDNARQGGVDMTVSAYIKVSKLCRHHRMPATGIQHVQGGALGAALDGWVDGLEVDDELLAAFMDAYGLPQAELCDDGVDDALVTL